MGTMDGQRGLFPAAPYMSDSARYPRGYNPHRMREVRDALDTGGLGHSDGTYIWSSISNGEVEADPKRGRSGYFERDQVRQTIARSTMPTSDLRHLNSIRTGVLEPGAAGFYNHEESDAWTGKAEPAASVFISGTIKGRTADEMRAEVRYGSRPATPSLYDGPNDVGQTLIHELGHHAQNAPHLDQGRSFEWRGNQNSRDPVAVTDPALEAGAVNYEEQHFRNDHRFAPARPVTEHAYDQTFIKHAFGAHPAERANWALAYGKVRNLSAEQFRPKPAKPQPEQMRLL
jgi:hypothetical protein